MDAISQAVRYNDLLSLYGKLLSETQRAILEDYYSFNLSISEIAENRNVSRAAIEDAMKKGKKKLDEIEGQVGNYAVLKRIEEMKNTTKEKENLEEIERMMKHGI
ncbi:MAG: DNA-binding protein [Bacilli bacterium]|nr:DNA-binding protein [Bacilli bacterium]